MSKTLHAMDFRGPRRLVDIIERRNPFLTPIAPSRAVWFAYGFAAATAFCAVIVWVTMR